MMKVELIRVGKGAIVLAEFRLPDTMPKAAEAFTTWAAILTGWDNDFTIDDAITDLQKEGYDVQRRTL